MWCRSFFDASNPANDHNMLIHFLLWIHIAVLSFVLGLTLFKCLGQRAAAAPDAVILTGFVSLTVLCGYWSLCAPLDATANVLVTALAAGLAWYVRREAFAQWMALRNGWAALDWPHRAAIVLLGLVVLAYSVQAPEVYDSGLYHVQAIQWAKAYPVVPGLGNLHGRFAFNAHSFLVSALFSGFSAERLYFPVNGFLLCLLCARITVEIHGALRRSNTENLVFSLFLGVLSLFFLVRICHSPTPDVFVAVLLAFAGLYAYKVLSRPENAANQSLRIATCALLALAPCIKLSAALGLLLLAALWPLRMRTLLRLAAVVGVALLPFLLRNVVLSGYLIFPFPALDLFDFDWEIPRAEVLAEKRYIETWARIVDYDVLRIASMTWRDWLPIWWQHLSGLWKSIMLLCALLPLATLWYTLKKRPGMAIFTLAILLNLAFWFVTAPDPRFALGFLLLGAASTAAAVSEIIFPRENTPISRIFEKNAVYLPLAAMIAVLGMAVLKIRLNGEKIVRPVPLEAAQVRSYNFTGLPIFIPAAGERCFGCPLPCTPLLNERLQLRGENMESGFRIRR
jgi:hypothetical protein